jgi:hypothetical protein
MLAAKTTRAPIVTAKTAATSSTSSRILSTLKTMPAAAAAAGAKAGTDLLRKAAAAMAMQPRKVVKAVTGAVGAASD